MGMMTFPRNRCERTNCDLSPIKNTNVKVVVPSPKSTTLFNLHPIDSSINASVLLSNEGNPPGSSNREREDDEASIANSYHDSIETQPRERNYNCNCTISFNDNRSDDRLLDCTRPPLHNVHEQEFDHDMDLPGDSISYDCFVRDARPPPQDIPDHVVDRSMDQPDDSSSYDSLLDSARPPVRDHVVDHRMDQLDDSLLGRPPPQDIRDHQMDQPNDSSSDGSSISFIMPRHLPINRCQNQNDEVISIGDIRSKNNSSDDGSSLGFRRPNRPPNDRRQIQNDEVINIDDSSSDGSSLGFRRPNRPPNDRRQNQNDEVINIDDSNHDGSSIGFRRPNRPPNDRRQIQNDEVINIDDSSSDEICIQNARRLCPPRNIVFHPNNIHNRAVSNNDGSSSRRNTRPPPPHDHPQDVMSISTPRCLASCSEEELRQNEHFLIRVRSYQSCLQEAIRIQFPLDNVQRVANSKFSVSSLLNLRKAIVGCENFYVNWRALGETVWDDAFKNAVVSLIGTGNFCGMGNSTAELFAWISRTENEHLEKYPFTFGVRNKVFYCHLFTEFKKGADTRQFW